ncbi:MAG: HEAT repeat domain-containing protein [Lentisphaeria bacterium]|nr:HEAT repeat domain-containing protein [Lentisphaeria bacterium]
MRQIVKRGRISVLAALTGVVLLGPGCAGAAAQKLSGPAARRQALLQAAKRGVDGLPVLAKGLTDANPVVQRTAARLLADLGASARAEMTRATESKDMLARRTAYMALCKMEGVDQTTLLGKALGDEDATVRLYAVNMLIGIRPRTPQIKELLDGAAKDDSPLVRNPASKALWPFHRNVVRLRDRKDWDHDVHIVNTIPLPKDGWKFHLDPKRSGHRAKWFKPTFEDAKWADIAIEQAWQKAGYDYTGVSWYRRTVDIPEKIDNNAVEITFKGIDESAWVWVNGVYVGDHDIGPNGWNVSFSLDITKEIKWGQPNQITVRAMNTAHAGGIWQPVMIEVLK